jgi:ligand-binding sensor domain-containing protein
MRRDLEEDAWLSIHGSLSIEMVNGIALTREAPHDLGIQDATCMAILNGDIWIGRERGITVYSPKKHRRVDVTIPEKLSRAKITDLTEDGNSLWVGTRDGVYRYEMHSQIWQRFGREDSLPSSRVSVVAVGDGEVWIGTSDNGVARYDKHTQDWVSFGLDDGLSDHNIRGIVIDDRYVWFGTFSAGVCRYDRTNGLWTNYRTADYRVSIR